MAQVPAVDSSAFLFSAAYDDYLLPRWRYSSFSSSSEGASVAGAGVRVDALT